MPTTGLDAFEVSEDQTPGEGPEGEDTKWGALRIIGLVALVGAFSGFVYLAYMQGVRNGSAGAPPLITAQSGPYKERPVDPGGRSFDDAGKMIYDRVNGKQPGVAGSPTSSSPEAPVRLPQSAQRTTSSERSESLVVADNAPGKPQQRPGGISAAIDRSGAQGGPDSVATVESPKKVPDTVPRETPSRGEKPVTEPKTTEPETKTVKIEASTRPAASLTGSPARDGAYLIQIASYRDRPSVEGAWRKLIEKHSDLVSTLSPDYQTAEIAGKGTYFRLRIGPFESQADAGALCSALKSRRQDCLVVKN